MQILRDRLSRVIASEWNVRNRSQGSILKNKDTRRVRSDINQSASICFGFMINRKFRRGITRKKNIRNLKARLLNGLEKMIQAERIHNNQKHIDRHSAGIETNRG